MCVCVLGSAARVANSAAALAVTRLGASSVLARAEIDAFLNEARLS